MARRHALTQPLLGSGAAMATGQPRVGLVLGGGNPVAIRHAMARADWANIFQNDADFDELGWRRR